VYKYGGYGGYYGGYYGAPLLSRSYYAAPAYGYGYGLGGYGLRGYGLKGYW